MYPCLPVCSIPLQLLACFSCPIEMPSLFQNPFGNASRANPQPGAYKLSHTKKAWSIPSAVPMRRPVPDHRRAAHFSTVAPSEDGEFLSSTVGISLMSDRRAYGVRVFQPQPHAADASAMLHKVAFFGHEVRLTPTLGSGNRRISNSPAKASRYWNNQLWCCFRGGVHVGISRTRLGDDTLCVYLAHLPV